MVLVNHSVSQAKRMDVMNQHEVILTKAYISSVEYLSFLKPNQNHVHMQISEPAESCWS